MDTTLVPQYTCECNGRNYSDDKKLKLHMKTQGHLSWEMKNEMKSLKIELTKRDNIISSLERKLLERDQRIMVLKERSKVLKNCLQSKLDDL